MAASQARKDPATTKEAADEAVLANHTIQTFFAGIGQTIKIIAIMMTAIVGRLTWRFVLAAGQAGKDPATTEEAADEAILANYTIQALFAGIGQGMENIAVIAANQTGNFGNDGIQAIAGIDQTLDDVAVIADQTADDAIWAQNLLHRLADIQRDG
ncbi:hypothetical protein BA190_13520 [Labrys sp. WJW]|nr:hypothetical protein BA190_13520 [Labrys sp. WJW]